MMLGKECVAGFFAAAVFLLASGSGLWAASESHIQAANKEGTVLVYGGTTLEHMTTLIGNFNRTYPAIEVKYLRKSRKALFELILRELRAKTYNADVYMPIEISEALHLADRKLLARYASPERNFIPEKLKDKQGYWTTLYQTGHVYAYNTQLVAPKDIPRSYDDLLDPKWRGRIIMHNEEEFWYASVLEILGKEKGTSLMRGLAQQKPQFQGSKTLMMQLLCAGEVALAIPVNFNQANDAVKKGCPSDWVVIEPQTQRPPFVVAMAPNAPHPAAAKLFIDFMLSKEPQKFMQENIFRQSGRSDVEPSGDLVKLKGVRTWESDWDLIFKNAAGHRDNYRKIFNLQ
ncbi:MAG: ABC transporter substrate-binding protein [Candidatus Binatia bacterium]